jgi:hypothetical protein
MDNLNLHLLLIHKILNKVIYLSHLDDNYTIIQII